MSQQLTPFLRSPRQASEVFVTGGMPKQRHTFVVQFIKNGGSATVTDTLTFAVKTCDRPSIQPKVEELNQYNKKRLITTGYKTNPIKIGFYDSADGSAQRMFSDYSKYYFGDFSQTASSYLYDATNLDFKDATGSGAGFTGFNGGSKDPDAQFYFKQINILHFYSGTYDLYTLINPKFNSFDPDELDYSNSEVSMINAQISFENMLYFVNAPSQGYPGISDLEEFQRGSAFNGDAIEIPGDGVGQRIAASGYSSPFATGSGLSVEEILNYGREIPVDESPDYRYYNSQSTGGLGLFGNFLFGANPANRGGVSANISLLATGNPALAAALNLNISRNGLSVSGSVATAFGAVGINGPQYNQVSSSVRSNYSGYGGGADLISQGLYANSIASGQNGSHSSPIGTLLSATAFAAINSLRSGSSQYGYNTVGMAVGTYSQNGSSAADGASYQANMATIKNTIDILRQSQTQDPVSSYPAPPDVEPPTNFDPGAIY